MTVQQYHGINIVNFPQLVCDECNSTEIVENEQGYVCSRCGLTLECQRLEYNRPYEVSKLQYKSYHNTMIGTQAERSRNPHSREFNRLDKVHTSQSAPEHLQRDLKVREEIGRILGGLDLPESFRKPLFQKFKFIYRKLKKGTKFRAPRKILPVILFYYCRQQNIPLKADDFLDFCKASSTDFREGRKEYLKVFPDYQSRDRVQIIKSFILKIRESLGLDYEFYENALKIAQYFWKYIHQTTDAVVAGLVSSVAVLCDYERYSQNATISDICRVVGIMPSTVHSQVQCNIVPQLGIKEFETPVKSSHLIKVHIYEFGILEDLEGTDQKPSTVVAPVGVITTSEMVSGTPIRLEAHGSVEVVSEEFMKVYTEAKTQLNAQPSRKVRLDVLAPSGRVPELHVFKITNPESKKDEYIALEFHPRLQSVVAPDRYGFGAQKGPPWENAPFIDPG